jgi:hypothetical protein
MPNNINSAKSFIKDKDSKLGARWSDDREALAKALIEYADVKIKEYRILCGFSPSSE